MVWKLHQAITQKIFVFVLVRQFIGIAVSKKVGYTSYNFQNPEIDVNEEIVSNYRIKPTLKTWDSIDQPKHVSLTAMVVDHHSDGSWYLQALHEKYSIGWNRTIGNQFLNRPFACNIRFLAVGLESTLKGFETGGTGYMTIADDKKKLWHGFDKNETNRLHCYYTTQKDTGSEFLDTPKTLGLAIYCPVTLDQETGPFEFKSTMGQGNYCRLLADYSFEIEMHLRPSDFSERSDSQDTSRELIGEAMSVPAAPRMRQIRDLMTLDPRPHAVCTVQTFRNHQTGPMLYLFVAYYQIMGWRVIVYDRFGLHEKYLKDLLSLPGVDYYPYTLYQLAQPTKYNQEYADKLDDKIKSYYKMEVSWGYTSKKLADTADQDADKSRTYDYARLEYSHLDMILYIDADEIFYCPQAPSSVTAQRRYQQRVMGEFSTQGIEEMRFVRIPYSGMAPMGFINNQENRSNIDFTNNTHTCMKTGYDAHSLLKMAECWSTGTSFDNFPKSADLASVCPFHYNHWSCDGMKGGGRDFTKRRCRCKVAFDMQNGYEYKPQLKKCHLMHFNDNKYRFQSKRSKYVYDRGDVTVYNPLVKLLLNYKSEVVANMSVKTETTTTSLGTMQAVESVVNTTAADS